MLLFRLDVFNIDVGVFDNEDERLEVLRAEGCSSPNIGEPGAIASTYLDETDSGEPRLTMVLKPHATRAVWAHEAVHVADFLMMRLGIPTGRRNTELRAYIVQYVFARLDEELPEPVTSTPTS